MAIEPVAPNVPTVSWDTLAPQLVESWEAGEHLAIVGPTGQGKTTFALYMLSERHRRRGAHIVILATKPRDATLKALRWPVLRVWPPEYGQNAVILWPTYGTPRTAPARQRKIFEPALIQMFADGNRVIYFDEIAYFEDELRLKPLLNQFWMQARAMGLTMVAGTQRPRNVSRYMFSEPSWLVFFGVTDVDELKRVGEIGGGKTDVVAVRDAVRSLGEHEFLVVQSRSGIMVKSKVKRRAGGSSVGSGPVRG